MQALKIFHFQQMQLQFLVPIDNPTWGYNALSMKMPFKQENSVSRHHC